MKTDIICACLLMINLAGCAGEGHSHETGRETEEHSDEIHFSREQAEAVGLKVETVARGTFSWVIKTGGEILSPQGGEVTLAATANGIVSFANPSITDGTAVKSGETIVRIAAGNLPEGDPGVKAKIAYETALKEYRRAEELVREQIISAKEFEQTRLRYETAKTVYEAQAAGHSPEGVRVTTPIGGFIRQRLVGQGEYVAVGQPVAVISQSRRLQLKVDVPGKYYRELRRVRSANFKMSGDDTLYKLSGMNGRLLSFGKAAGPSSFYVPVTFEFDNTGDFLPGAFSEVYLIAEPQEQVITVPVSAVTEEQGLYFVYLRLDEEGYMRREVTLGASDGERILALDGLKEGDALVTEGAYQLKLAAATGMIPEGEAHNH
ncbi:MAG: efflux RND transporter periplasmic adaptor subunit [Tannerella sp.]|nr:efflux RND transporter periplasmic adaptor subunit [Tannerella sp.]